MLTLCHTENYETKQYLYITHNDALLHSTNWLSEYKHATSDLNHFISFTDKLSGGHLVPCRVSSVVT